MASHTNTGPARSELTTVITIDDALILFQPGAQHPQRALRRITRDANRLGYTVRFDPIQAA